MHDKAQLIIIINITTAFNRQTDRQTDYGFDPCFHHDKLREKRSHKIHDKAQLIIIINITTAFNRQIDRLRRRLAYHSRFLLRSLLFVVFSSFHICISVTERYDHPGHARSLHAPRGQYLLVIR